MSRFEQIIEDQYKRLGIALEQDEDETEKDNADQAKELSAAKQQTDKAEDEAHAANTDAQSARQELASKQTAHSTKVANTSREKAKKIKA